MNDITQYTDDCDNFQCQKYLLVTNTKVDTYNNIIVAVSGGADSDIMLDMFAKCDADKKVKYVFCNTGLEYQATKNHLDYLEKQYDIHIERLKPKKTIPTCCKEYGQPFLSKNVSEMIRRLQAHNFKWEDRPFEELYVEYPNCKSALQWWCDAKGDGSRFGISRNKWLKEFMIINPPTFKISNLCCTYTKKNLVHSYLKENNCDLDVTGIRKLEGGARATAYKNCFDKNDDGYDRYRPLFFFDDDDKSYYKEHFNITYSDCYEVWGMKRTGCVGCPYGQHLEEEIKLCEKYEPKLAVAIKNVFKDSYEYTRKYREFAKKMKEIENKK